MTVPRFSNHSYTQILLRLHLQFVQSRMTMLSHRHITCLHSLITHRAQRSDLLMTKIVNSWNDFDPLKRVIVGRADFSVIPPEEPATSEKVPIDSEMRGMWGPPPLADCPGPRPLSERRRRGHHQRRIRRPARPHHSYRSPEGRHHGVRPDVGSDPCQELACPIDRPQATP